MPGTGLFRLIYASRSRIGGDAAMLASILAAARTNNAAVGITGVLLHAPDGFAQVLEGSLPAVSAAFERIQNDPRHGDVTVLEAGPAEARLFPAWSMAAVDRAEAPELAWPVVTADPAVLLDVLRQLLAGVASGPAP
ncbi:MAG: BLUF domain-containing protein [Acetobacteraceae bacterium]